jgi:hypothetical protein
MFVKADVEVAFQSIILCEEIALKMRRIESYY